MYKQGTYTIPRPHWIVSCSFGFRRPPLPKERGRCNPRGDIILTLTIPTLLCCNCNNHASPVPSLPMDKLITSKRCKNVFIRWNYATDENGFRIFVRTFGDVGIGSPSLTCKILTFPRHPLYFCFTLRYPVNHRSSLSH